MSRQQNQREIQVMSFVEYCHNRQARENFTFIYSNGVGRYACGTTQEKIDELYPVPSKLFRRENSDTSRNWLQDI